MLLVKLRVNNPSIFLPWLFLSLNSLYCNVFFSDIILLIISILILSYYVSVCCVSISITLRFNLEYKSSILRFGSCWCVSLFICWCISNISRSEKQPTFIIILIRSASLWLAVLNQANSSHISTIISFIYPYRSVAPKIVVKWKFFVIFCDDFCSDLRACLGHRLCTKKKNSPHSHDSDRISQVCYQVSTHRSWHTGLLSGSHVELRFGLSCLSWVVYCDNTRPSGCLLSMVLTMIWPSSLISQSQEWKKLKNKIFKFLKF